MATTRLMPLHTGKGRTVAEALGRTTDYVKNPEKTDGGELVSAYQCNPAIVDQEFLFSKRQYAAMTGRNQMEHDVIAYHLRQSFKPGEITPELANKIGYELAMSLTKGKHAFIVCTHVDKEHIHSHIVFNSTSLDCSRKFNNFWGSSFAVRKISDLLCIENGLSVIDDPRPSRGSYGSWLGEKPPTVREQLERMIDAALTGCKDFDSFLAVLKTAGVEVKRGKHLAFKIPGGKKFIRCSSLGEDYSEEAIVERISGKRIVAPKGERRAPNLLIDIQWKMRQARSPGYERWASVFNLKEMAKTVSYEIPLPPLPEQHRIVNCIESLFAKLDEAKEKAQAVVDGVELRKSAILHKAFTGELTERWRKEHDKSDSDWRSVRFDEAAEIMSNLVDPAGYQDFPHIAPDNIEKRTGVLLEYHTIAEDGVKSGKHLFHAGQILYSKIRPNLSKIVMVDFDGLCSADMYPVNAKEDTRYLWYYMLSDEFLEQASNAGSRSVLPKINQKELSKVMVRMTSLEEQQAIVIILDNIFEKEKQAKEAAEAVLAQIDTMKKAILARAFRGELGTNDPGEEWAGELVKAVT